MTDTLTGSGAATNSGIEYQQRIAAIFLASLLVDLDISRIFNIDKPFNINQLRFETSENIDDLEVHTEDQEVIFLQIKRSLVLSKKKDSEFYSTIFQFVKEYIRSKESRNYYILVTSSDASKSITKDLKIFLDGIRLNDTGYSRNPVNKTITENKNKYESIVRDIYKSETGIDMTKADLLDFSKRVFIHKIDIEKGGQYEHAIMLYLSQYVLVDPELIWNKLIGNALYYSANRLSVNKYGLLRNFNNYIKNDKNTTIEISEEDFRFFELKFEGSLSSGKEVLLFYMHENDRYILTEFARFNDDCSRRLEFFEDKFHIIGTSYTWRLVYRCSSMYRIEQEILELSEILGLGDKGLDIMETSLGDEDLKECAKIHSDFCRRLYETNKDILKCIHCSKSISENNSLWIEIDDNDRDAAVGIIHKECRTPIDRVIGVIQSDLFRQNTYLKRFDYKGWLDTIFGGQGAYVSGSLVSRPVAFIWEPKDYDMEYNFCVRVTLKDGSFRYISDRRRVLRETERNAKDTAKKMNQQYEEGRKLQDPLCYTSENFLYGRYSILVGIKNDDEKCIECLRAEVVRYTKQIGDYYNTVDRWYTPICLIIDKQTEEPFKIKNTIVMITDPLKLHQFIENWTTANIYIGDYEIKIIKDDRDFDNKVATFFEDEYSIVIDPLVDMSQNIIKGKHLLSSPDELYNI